MTKIAEPKTPGGSPRVSCNLCHHERVANASRQKGHLLHLKEGWEGCKGVPPPPNGQQHSLEEEEEDEWKREQGEDMEDSG